MLIERQIRRQIQGALFQGKILVLFGPRQVGKTTLVKAVLAEYPGKSSYVSCDLPETQKLLQEPRLEDLRRFVGDSRLVALDEAQRVENIGRALKILHEHFPETQFVATGSSSFELGRSVKEPLTGRKREFQLSPISLVELAPLHDFNALREWLPHLLRFGAYPEAITSPNPAEVVRAIAEDYLFRDILELENFKSVSRLRSLLEAAALQLGSEVSTTELSRLAGLSRETVERYLDLLERSYILFRLRALSRNPRKEIAKGHKIYFHDLGIRNSLIKNFNELPLRADVGALWENFCINERLKYHRHSGRLINPWFWRTYDQKELDFVEEGGGRFTAFEFKWGAGPARGAKAFQAAYPGSTVEVIRPQNVWAFAGVPG